MSFKPTEILQGCVGLSFVLLSIGGMWSMISGARVELRAAGAMLTVNEGQKLVEEALEDTEDIVNIIQRSPAVPKSQKKQLQQKLSTAKDSLSHAEEEINDDAEKLLGEED